MTLEQIVALARKLSPVEKLHLVERVIPDLEALVQGGQLPRPASLYGSLADLGRAPSAKDIGDTRREMFQNFPRPDAA
jgi:hypothetical protein